MGCIQSKTLSSREERLSAAQEKKQIAEEKVQAKQIAASTAARRGSGARGRMTPPPSPTPKYACEDRLRG